MQPTQGLGTRYVATVALAGIAGALACGLDGMQRDFLSVETMMKKSVMLKAVAVLALSACAGAWAAAPSFSGDAVLAKPVAAASDQVVDGVTWHCEAAKCAGKAERRSTLDSQMKECRRVAEALGELVEYSSRGRPMSKSAVETCNKLAADKASAE
jgi:hypothetical protein